MHPSLRTFPKSWGCYRYLALLCAFGHSPCLTAWRQSPVSRWGGRFGAGWFHLGLFPNQNHPACVTTHTEEERGCHPVCDCLTGQQLWPEVSIRQCFPHSSSLHPPTPNSPSPGISFPAWRDQQQIIPGSHRWGSHQNPVLSLQGTGRTSSGPTVSHFSGIQSQQDATPLMLPGCQGQ